MILKLSLMQITFAFLLVCVWGFDETFGANGSGSEEMLEQGKIQYQLLQERGKLPKYGSCWKQAVEFVDEGCRALSEETQSDIALYLSNCFLEMSGHDTYNCVHDKKPNLRGICISSMTDRAFAVYTTFYTHTQNICWFLRGQVWQETISENTFKVGKQLEKSAKNQETLLQNQEHSLEVQKRLIQYGKSLEVIMHDFFVQAKEHRELLGVMGRSLGHLQGFIMGEISWLDTIIFYIAALILCTFFTSSLRTYNARLPIFVLLGINIFVERMLCKLTSFNTPRDMEEVSRNYYEYIWYIRYFFVTISVVILMISCYFYKDFATENNHLLQKLSVQFSKFTEDFEYKNNDKVSGKYLEYSVEETLKGASNYLNSISNEFEKSFQTDESKLKQTTSSVKPEYVVITPKMSKENVPIGRINTSSVKKKLQPLFELQNNMRYNLRSRQGTPDSSFRTSHDVSVKRYLKTLSRMRLKFGSKLIQND